MSLNLEKTVKDWIDADPDGDGLTAYLEVPADRPQRLVTIERVGGSELEYSSHPILAIQVWAETRWQAAQLATGTLLPDCSTSTCSTPSRRSAWKASLTSQTRRRPNPDTRSPSSSTPPPNKTTPHHPKGTIMAETNHNNKKNVSLGKPKKTGCLYYAPAGTALPTDATTALPTTYTCVGYLSEDGVTNATDTDTTDINEMGGIKVLSEISGYGETWQFNMIETNEASLKLRFGTANVTGTADKLTVYHAIPSGESLVLVFEIAMTGNRVKRIVVADGTITEFDDTTYSAGDAIGYGVTMSANPSDLINGATSVEYIAKVTTATISDK